MIPRLLLGVALCSVACGVPIPAQDAIAKAKTGKASGEKAAEPKPDPTPADEPVIVKSRGLVIDDVAQAKPNPRPKEWTVADILAGLKIDESMLIYEDEPPGKLRALRCVVALPGNGMKAYVRIELKFRIVSVNFEWDKKAVRAAKVARVVITPGGSDE